MGRRTDERMSGDPSALLSVRGVTLRYRTKDQIVTATYRVSFDVLRSDRFVVLGPSGCGKSTLLKAVGGFIAPVEGEIVLDGKAVTGPGPDRVLVFQEFDQLLPWKTVRDNVAFALTASGKLGRRDALERADHYLAKVGLDRFAAHYPHTLSGGMKQRVAIARAMAMEPAILLMDEPFAALDAQLRTVLQDELLDLWQSDRRTVLFVTHSLEEAILLGDRVVVMSARPGRLVADIPVPFERPRTGELRGAPEFAALEQQIWDVLRGEVDRSLAKQGASAAKG